MLNDLFGMGYCSFFISGKRTGFLYVSTQLQIGTFDGFLWIDEIVSFYSVIGMCRCQKGWETFRRISYNNIWFLSIEFLSIAEFILLWLSFLINLHLSIHQIVKGMNSCMRISLFWCKIIWIGYNFLQEMWKKNFSEWNLFAEFFLSFYLSLLWLGRGIFFIYSNEDCLNWQHCAKKE